MNHLPIAWQLQRRTFQHLRSFIGHTDGATQQSTSRLENSISRMLKRNDETNCVCVCGLRSLQPLSVSLSEAQHEFSM